MTSKLIADVLRDIEQQESAIGSLTNWPRSDGQAKTADVATGRFCFRHKGFKACSPRSRKVEAIKVHYLAPGRYKVTDKLLLSIRTSIDFSQRPELGV